MYILTPEAACIRLSDGAVIPFAADNAAYQQYRAWVDSGNAPSPYVAPSVPVPRIVSKRQATRALLAAGVLDIVDAAIATMPRESQIDWTTAYEVDRDHPLVLAMAQALSLDLDALFSAAAAL